MIYHLCSYGSGIYTTLTYTILCCIIRLWTDALTSNDRTQANLVIITGSIPTLRPLFQKSFYQSRSSTKALSTSAEGSRRKQWLPMHDSGPVIARVPGTVTNITGNEENMTSYRIKDKSASEEYILPNTGTVSLESQTEVPAIHIMTDVGVHFENRERG